MISVEGGRIVRRGGGPLTAAQRASYRRRDYEIWREVRGGATLQAVGDAHGLSRERVRQICARVSRRKVTAAE